MHSAAGLRLDPVINSTALLGKSIDSLRGGLANSFPEHLLQAWLDTQRPQGREEDPSNLFSGKIPVTAHLTAAFRAGVCSVKGAKTHVRPFAIIDISCQGA